MNGQDPKRGTCYMGGKVSLHDTRVGMAIGNSVSGLLGRCLCECVCVLWWSCLGY